MAHRENIELSLTHERVVRNYYLRKVIEMAFSYLSPKQEKVARAYFGFGRSPLSYKEISIEFSITVKTAYACIHDIIERFRRFNRRYNNMLYDYYDES